MQSALASTGDHPAIHSPFRTHLARVDGSPIKVLVVDDERIVAEMTSMTLRCEGADVVTAADGAHAISAARRTRIDLVVIDPRLPDMDGIRCLRALREQQPGILLLLLNATGREPDRIARATAGEHWLTKPFSLEEVLLKVRVMLRRDGVALCRNDAEFVVADLVLNEENREVSRADDEIHLSYTEFELLRFFMRNEHRVVTKRQILAHVWPYNFAGRPSVVELYVSYLRKKIDTSRTPLIHTLRRTGYMLKSPTAEGNSAHRHALATQRGE